MGSLCESQIIYHKQDLSILGFLVKYQHFISISNKTHSYNLDPASKSILLFFFLIKKCFLAMSALCPYESWVHIAVSRFLTGHLRVWGGRSRCNQQHTFSICYINFFKLEPGPLPELVMTFGVSSVSPQNYSGLSVVKSQC